MALTRRELMAASGLTALPLAKAFGGDELLIQGRRLAGLLTLPHAAHYIAAAYLRSVGRSSWRDAALNLGLFELLAPIAQITDAESLRVWLGTRIRADFAAREVVDVDGWRLSRTEVGACLLAIGAA